MHGTLGANSNAHSSTSFTPWSPGCNPAEHPLWQEQVELELEMVRRGVAKYQKRNAEARKKEEMTGMDAFRHTLEDAVAKMVPHFKATLTKIKRSRGPKPLSYEKLLELDPAVASLICLRTIFDSVTIGNMRLPLVAIKIGREVEYQVRMDTWMASAPDLYFGVQNSISKHATSRHIKRVNINRFNALMKEKLQWQAWSPDMKRNVGFRLIEIAVQSTGMILVNGGHTEIQYDRPIDGQGERPFGRKTVKDITPPTEVLLTEQALEALAKRMDADETRHPQFLPTLMPPKRWDEGIFSGGYYTPVVNTPSLVRFHAEGDEQRQAALEEYDNVDMPRVLSALHYVQETPWAINRKVLEVALSMWQRDLAIAGFPKQDLMPPPPKPDGFKEATKLMLIFEPRLQAIPAHKYEDRKAEIASWPQEAKAAWDMIREWKRTAAGVHGSNHRRTSKIEIVRTTLEIAEMFMHRTFYFPHMLDFRGRMYPISTYLQPQGNDLARGLLTFAKGKAIGEEGAEWLAIHLAGHFGADKMTYEGRIQWVRDNEEVWRTIAKDPIGSHHLWLNETGIKHHWQGLAAVFEWVRYLDEGHGMVSSLPIHIDGTCNGIQHLSAMMKDEVGGAAVNLVPDDKPHDIYGDVARKLTERLLGIAAAGGRMGVYARAWLDLCDGSIPRSLTKKPVMTTPYGATREAHFGSLYAWLQENIEDKGGLPFASTEEKSKKRKRKLVPWLIAHLEDALKDIVSEAKTCMKWLQDVAKVVAATNRPIVWRTPSGFVVRHFYGKLKSIKTRTSIDGRSIQIKLYDRTDQLSEREQLQGIAPNFTHSMDASANTETIIRLALNSEQPPITAIHDAYGSVAGAMWQLFAAVRQAFIWVHSDDVLSDFRKVCVTMQRDHLIATTDIDMDEAARLADEAVKPLPPRGALNLTAVASSDYFFA